MKTDPNHVTSYCATLVMTDEDRDIWSAVISRNAYAARSIDRYAAHGELARREYMRGKYPPMLTYRDVRLGHQSRAYMGLFDEL
jgi:hypothetical protein